MSRLEIAVNRAGSLVACPELLLATTEEPASIVPTFVSVRLELIAPGRLTPLNSH